MNVDLKLDFYTLLKQKKKYNNQSKNVNGIMNQREKVFSTIYNQKFRRIILNGNFEYLFLRRLVDQREIKESILLSPISLNGSRGTRKP